MRMILRHKRLGLLVQYKWRSEMDGDIWLGGHIIDKGHSSFPLGSPFQDRAEEWEEVPPGHSRWKSGHGGEKPNYGRGKRGRRRG